MTIELGYVILYVDDVDATLDFYTTAFDLPRRFLADTGDYGELETGASTLAFASTALADANLASAGGFARLDPDGLPPAVTITLLAEDVAAAVERAVDAGARRYVDPIEKPWGQTVAYLVDPNGALVEVATPVPSS